MENPLTLPKIGLGVWQMKPAVCKAAVLKAIEIGYRLIDTAQAYYNEQAVGEALAENTIDRKELTIATKVFPFNYRKLKSSVYVSKKKLQIDQIDILYTHWPWWILGSRKSVFKHMDELVDEGITKYIAISNCSGKETDKIQALTKNKIVANQVQMYPLFQQKELRQYCKDHDMYLVAYSPLGRGEVYKVPELKAIAEKNHASISQVTLAWEIAQGVIPIPKASSAGHLEDNFKALELELDDEDIALLNGLKKKKNALQNM
jgi:2,5-diketo-D-gluconate reductase B